MENHPENVEYVKRAIRSHRLLVAACMAAAEALNVACDDMGLETPTSLADMVCGARDLCDAALAAAEKGSK